MPGAITAQATVAGEIVIWGVVVARIIVFQRLLVSYWDNPRYGAFIAGVIAIWGAFVEEHLLRSNCCLQRSKWSRSNSRRSIMPWSHLCVKPPRMSHV